MIESVTIIDKNVNGILAEGIMYATIKNLSNGVPEGDGKDYIFYCLNEMVDSEQTKIYVAEAADQPGKANPIADDEWKIVTNALKAISHKEETPNVTFKKMTGATFYTSDPKKLAIKLPVKQIFKDAHFSATLAINQPAPAATQGNPVFIDNSQTQANTETATTATENNLNAFAATPTITTVDSTSDNQQNTNLSTDAENINNSQGDNSTENGTSNIDDQGVPNVTMPPINMAEKNDGPAFAEQPASAYNTVESGESVLQEEPPLLPPDQSDQSMSDQNKQGNKNEDIEVAYGNGVTKQEAQKAVEVLAKYFGFENQLKEIPQESIVQEKKEQTEPLSMSNIEETNITSEGNTLPQETNDSSIENEMKEPNEEQSNENLIQESTIIDTSVGGLNSSNQVETAPNDLTPVNFEIPTAPEPPKTLNAEVTNPMTLQPTSTAPKVMEPVIPLADPIAPMPSQIENHPYVASTHQGAVTIDSSDLPGVEMPPVQLPPNAAGIGTATGERVEQWNLGPAGLSGDVNKLDLTA